MAEERQQQTIKNLRDKLDDMLVAEVKRHGGIPHLSKEEMDFREALMEFLEQQHSFLQIAQIECEYWKNVADRDQGPGGNVDGCGIEGMGAAGNIIAAVVMGLTPEQFKAKKEEQ